MLCRQETGTDISRRDAMKFIGKSTVSLFPTRPLLTEWENRQAAQMEQAVTFVQNMRDDIRNAIITGTDLQQLSPTQLRFIRKDDGLLEEYFPLLGRWDRQKLKTLISFSKKDGVIIHNTKDVLTAYRKNPRTRLWMKAGFVAPASIPMDEKTAFAQDKDKPWKDPKTLAFSI